jgi:tRNA nucleotidyltransferase (CCA-adding enzyme)
MDDAVLEVARIVRKAGGRAFLVGGCVRDGLLAKSDIKDFDIEVFGIAPDVLQDELEKRFILDLVGLSFGVLKLHGHDIDVALPRRESKRGTGHRGFLVDSDPYMSVKEAASRRDFTINAIYLDPLTGEYEDPWRGREDIANGVLRHVSEKFAEDPLRVLRGMQFAARFGFEPNPSTIGLCRKMSMENLPPERLMEEWKKFLLKGKWMSKGLMFLRRAGWTRHFPELSALIGCRQDPQWHPEGDVWNHTCCCLDAFAAQRGDCSDSHENLIVGLAVLCHDFGKPSCTRYDPKRGRIRSLGHDVCGEAPALSFLRRLTNEERILKEVPPLVKYHMLPYAMWKGNAKDSAIRRLALKVGSIDRLIRVCAADAAGRPPYPRDCESLEWLAKEATRLKVRDSMPKRIVQGRDLISLGMKPGVAFGEILKTCFEAQLDGAFADRAGAMEYLKRIVCVSSK